MAQVPIVDKDACIGCGACAGVCPKVFRMAADGKSEVSDATGASESEVQAAIDGCPVGAISWKKA